MTTTRERRAAVVDGLRAAGLRVAARPADVATPCVYVATWEVAAEGGTVADPGQVAVAIWWLPVRELSHPDTDDDALDAVVAAVAGLGFDAFAMTSATITVNDQAWPGWRGEVML